MWNLAGVLSANALCSIPSRVKLNTLVSRAVKATLTVKAQDGLPACVGMEH